MWIRRKVKPGQQTGRKLGYPTLNFNAGNFGNDYKPGVYVCEVQIRNKTHKGALYFGPKLGKPGFALEIYILDYSGNLYSQDIQFRPLRWIRAPQNFSSIEALKKQIQKDIEYLKLETRSSKI
ncbi:riboflavin kinase [Candidatus Peregrinibacteria bacterium]|nr:riboflavin kinase [Candidatus Peregrinibacteria bacterium]